MAIQQIKQPELKDKKSTLENAAQAMGILTSLASTGLSLSNAMGSGSAALPSGSNTANPTLVDPKALKMNAAPVQQPDYFFLNQKG